MDKDNFYEMNKCDDGSAHQGLVLQMDCLQMIRLWRNEGKISECSYFDRLSKLPGNKPKAFRRVREFGYIIDIYHILEYDSSEK